VTDAALLSGGSLFTLCRAVARGASYFGACRDHVPTLCLLNELGPVVRGQRLKNMTMVLLSISPPHNS
jgi:hypothetical protein